MEVKVGKESEYVMIKPDSYHLGLKVFSFWLLYR